MDRNQSKYDPSTRPQTAQNTKNVKLDSISFSNINITYSTTLGQIINDAGAGSFISNGAQTIIPDFPNVLQNV